MKYDVSLQTIAWLHGRRNDKTLEISPAFQRRPVWLAKERSALIATICELLPFPEIYIQHDTNLEDGSERHIVVDGQQRVTTILMFIDGEVALPDTAKWKARVFKDLAPEETKAFWNYKVVVRGLSDTNEAEIRDLFTKLNTNNIALNDQELRNARYVGRFKEAAERVADNPLFQNLGLFTPRDIRRMLDVEYASELLLLTSLGITHKKDILDEAYATYEEEFPREAEYEEQFNAVVGLIRTILTDGNAAQFKRKTNFYSLYGACLRYLRDFKRSSFNDPTAVGEAIGKFLARAQDERPDAPQDERAYHDAYTRSPSDKGRRVVREDVLYHLITDTERKTTRATLPPA
jgi:hypothetical protein